MKKSQGRKAKDEYGDLLLKAEGLSKRISALEEMLRVKSDAAETVEIWDKPKKSLLPTEDAVGTFFGVMGLFCYGIIMIWLLGSALVGALK